MSNTHDTKRTKVEELFQTAFVRDQVNLVMPTVVKQSDRLPDAVLNYLLNSNAPCESPLEVIFVAWWMGMDWVFAGPNGNPRELALAPQTVVNVDGETSYRLDFQVVLSDTSGYFARAARIHHLRYPLIGVELDGHDFHERTKEQVTYRNRRDRNLQKEGWKVFHISGSELYKRGYEVVYEVYEYAHGEMVDLHAGIWQTENR